MITNFSGTYRNMKKVLNYLSYLKRVNTIFLISLCLVCPGYAAEREITLQWDHSINASNLQSYKIYYYTSPGDTGSLNTADYAVSYQLEEEGPILINPLTDPKPITINKNNTQITLHFSDATKIYYFVVTAFDMKGLESIPTNEVGSSGSGTGAGSGGSGAGGNSGGGGCFIATAAFGSHLDPHVKLLREFRDRFLITNSPGRVFVNYYYRYSPPIADVIRRNEPFKSATRWALSPLIYGIEHPYLLAMLIFIPAGCGLVRKKEAEKHGDDKKNQETACR
jgi:hypothetical protein